mmetsp:Transcript_72036/g.159082  ORF Transcript_72036/g.159082 Transcript_72036/m.159082 type:complete len:202 (+) Transcript_72036:499-1104(+)
MTHLFLMMWCSFFTVVSEGVGDPSFFCLEISFCFGSTALRSPKSILQLSEFFLSFSDSVILRTSLDCCILFGRVALGFFRFILPVSISSHWCLHTLSSHRLISRRKLCAIALQTGIGLGILNLGFITCSSRLFSPFNPSFGCFGRVLKPVSIFTIVFCRCVVFQALFHPNLLTNIHLLPFLTFLTFLHLLWPREEGGPRIL